MAKKCSINKDLCIGCGVCTSIAPDVLGFGEDGKAENILGEDKEISVDLESSVTEAAESCPVQAIIVED